jgi:molybdopterin converting factor small subunit
MKISKGPTKSIYIQIKLFATLSQHTPKNSDKYPIPVGTTVDELLAHLPLPANQVKMIFINGRKQALDTVLKKGDRIGIFPPVGGG